MNWILYRRADEAHWVAAYGPLSVFPGSLIVYGWLLLLGVLTLGGVLGMWQGRAGFGRVVAWCLGGWLLVFVTSILHARAWYRPEDLEPIVMTALGMPWVVYGAWRVAPFLCREAKEMRRGDHPSIAP